MSELFKFYDENEKRMEWLQSYIHTVVPYFGAGASKIFGYPLWKELLSELLEVTMESMDAKKIREKEKDLRLKISQKHYMHVADEIDKLLLPHTGNYISKLIETYNKELCNNPAINNLFDRWGDHIKYFPRKLFLTTNYDDLLERILTHSGIEKKEILPITVDDYINSVYGLRNLFSIYHLHGVYSKPDTIIFSNDNYDDYYGLRRHNDSKLNRKIQRLLYNLYYRQTFLFIGSSISREDRLFSLLANINKKIGFSSSPHYALLSIEDFIDAANENSSDQIKKIIKNREYRLLQWDIMPIWFSSNNISYDDAIYELFTFILKNVIQKESDIKEKSVKVVRREQEIEIDEAGRKILFD